MVLCAYLFEHTKRLESYPRGMPSAWRRTDAWPHTGGWKLDNGFHPPLRVAMISYHTCPLSVLGGKHTGGMNVYVRNLARVLGARGVHVDVFTRSENPNVPFISHDLGYGQRVVHIVAGPQHSLPKPLWPYFLDDFTQAVLRLTSQRRWRYHLVHSHYWLSGLVARRLARHWKIPWVHMFHTLAERKPAAYHDEESPLRPQAERRIAHEAQRVVCATEEEQMFLHWHYGVPLERLTVVPPGVDLSRFYPIPQTEARAFVGLPEDQRVLLYVGRFDPIKGLDVLLEAMSRLKNRGILNAPHTTLMLIGGATDTPYQEDLEKLRALRDARGLQDLVTFAGPRSQETLPYYYAAADVVILPSHYESFGMVVLEAMACGRPVVATAVGGLLSLVRHGETGFLVAPQDAEGLAGYLALLLESPHLRQRLGRCAARYARRYAWPRIARRILRLYYRVLHEAQDE